MKNVLIFGLGNDFNKRKDLICNSYNVIGFIDNDVGKHDKQKKIFPPSYISEVEYDEIVICSSAYVFSMINQLLDMGVPQNKISTTHLFEKMTIIENGHFVVVKSGITIEITDSSDVVVLSELDETYREISGLDDGIFIDIGLNVGIVSMYYASKDYIGKVYAYEPFESTYKKALNNFSRNNNEIVKKINHYNYGLGYRDEKRFVEVFNEQYSGGNSTVISDNVSATEENGIAVIIKNAANEITRIMAENSGKNMICKIDTEGSEYEIFDILGENNLIHKIDVFIIEYHPVKGRDYNTIKQMLNDNEFTIEDVPATTVSNFGMIYAVNKKHGGAVRFINGKN